MRASRRDATNAAVREASSSAPCSGSSAPPAPPRMRAVSVAKYHPPASSSLAGPSAITRPSASRTARSAQDAANSGSCVATITAWPCSARRAQLQRELGLGLAIHPARGLVQRQHGRRVSVARDDRQRETLTLAAGQIARVALGHTRQPDRLQGIRGGLLDDVLVHEVVARVLQQQRDSPGPLDLAARRRKQPGGVTQERRLARAVATHQRDGVARMQRQLQPAQDRGTVAQLVPDAAQPQGGDGLGRTTPRAPGWRHGGGLGGELGGVAFGEQTAIAQRGTRLAHADRQWAQVGEREQLRAGRLQRRGLARGPGQERGGVAIVGDATAAQGNHTIGRRQAALQAMLGQQDRRLPLLVQAAQQSDQLIAGHGVELRGRLIQEDHRRAARERRTERHALLLAAGELMHRAVEQRVDPQRERDLLHPARDGALVVPATLERESQLRAHGARHELGLGVLEQGARDGAELGGPPLAGVHAGKSDRAGEASAVKVRDQTTGGAQQRRLAVAGQAREQAQLSGLDLEADVVERRRIDARVMVGDAVEGEDRIHGSIPRRSVNGSRIAAISAMHSAPVAAVTGIWTRG